MLLAFFASAFASPPTPVPGVHAGTEIDVAVYDAREDDAYDGLERNIRPALERVFPDARVLRSTEWDVDPPNALMVRIEVLTGEGHTDRAYGVGSTLGGQPVITATVMPSQATVTLRVTVSDTRVSPTHTETITPSYTRRERSNLDGTSEKELRDAAFDRCMSEIVDLLLRFPDPGAPPVRRELPAAPPSSTGLFARQLYDAAGRTDTEVTPADIDAVWQRMRAGATVDALRAAADKASGSADAASLDAILTAGGLPLPAPR